MKRTILAACLTAFTTISNAGTLKGELDGIYRPIIGNILTKEVGVIQPEQLGQFVIYFEREGWADSSEDEQERVRRYMLVHGLVQGKVDPATFLAQHVLVNSDRTGIVYTQNDSIIPTSGDMFCSTGQPMKAMETINPVQGTGVYSHLEGGELKLSATINNCPGTEGFGNNNMTVKTSGYIKFASKVQ
ncbi:hypothetical protein [Hahella ganghwensis]|uniref:hypothetical protein n=1 Tax=Hahella ganghwensis TaxID=286420 RepID=UPI0003A07263|nr:hypothetical protein [Hahella ganghwensis]